MNNYVPILRFKEAERGAVRALAPSTRRCCTPLLELVPSDFIYSKSKTNKKAKRDGLPLADSDLADKLIGIGKDIVFNFAPGNVFVDFKLIDKLIIDKVPIFDKRKTHPLTIICNFMKTQQFSLFHPEVSIIPVTGLERSEEFQIAAKAVCSHDGNGLCIRVSRSDLQRDRLASDLSDLLDEYGISAQNSDLIIDLEHSADVPYTYSEICGKIPSITQWRNFVIVSGSLPENVGNMHPHDIYNIARDDYKIWFEQVVRENNLLRRPSFGDYTIRHPHYKNTDGFEPSASFYYTLADKWVLFRGERGSNDGAPSAKAQYREHAKMLCQMDFYYSSAFSYGDKYFESLCTGKPVGTPKSLIRAGINHHITVVVDQLAGLV